jgi:chromosomal replication initiator protein
VPASVRRPLPRRNEQTSLNPGFTFASFVASKAKPRACRGHASGRASISYNPLFVYGGVGLGERISSGDRQRHPAAKSSARIRYAHAETHVSDVVRLPAQGLRRFKRYYRSLDLLLIDDISSSAARAARRRNSSIYSAR